MSLIWQKEKKWVNFLTYFYIDRMKKDVFGWCLRGVLWDLLNLLSPSSTKTQVSKRNSFILFVTVSSSSVVRTSPFLEGRFFFFFPPYSHFLPSTQMTFTESSKSSTAVPKKFLFFPWGRVHALWSCLGGLLTLSPRVTPSRTIHVHGLPRSISGGVDSTTNIIVWMITCEWYNYRE